MAEAAIPSPIDGDSEDVHWALTTASSLARRGELQEALRWLRRAAAAARAAEQQVRAVDLERRASAYELALTGAPTMHGGAMVTPRSGSNNKTLEVASKPVPIDGLDEPTHVDTARPPPEEVVVMPTAKRSPSDAPWREDTVISRGIVPPKRNSRRENVSDDSVGSDTYSDVPSYAPDPDGDTQAMSHQPTDDFSSSSERSTQIDSLRVAILSGADGEPRLIALRGNAQAPEGAGVALLLPLSRQDASRIMNLLDQAEPRRR
jgi:hypothetical protein